MLIIQTINLLGVIVSAIISFLTGSIWYTLIFGKIWQKEVGLSDEQILKGNLAVTYGLSFINMIIMIVGLSILFSSLNVEKITDGFWVAVFIGLFFICTSTAINYLYQKKSYKLWLIDCGYQLLYLVVSGVILVLL